MPVISPRRSSTSASGSIYGTSSSSAAVGPTTSTDSSSSSRSVSDRYSSSGYKSYLDRAGSLSKLTGSSSSYSPSLSSYSSYSTYTPRSSTTYRSSASSLTGGSSGVGTYRSILPSLGSGSSSYDTTTLSRYGVRKHGKPLDTLKNDSNGRESTVSKKPPSGSDCSGAGSGIRDSKRLSGSSSSSSLARLVATSGLDMYEKYSPAHYKPNTELSGSRSGLNEASISNDIEERGGRIGDISNNTSTTANDIRSRHRYSRLYSRNDTDETDNVSSAIRSSSATALHTSASAEDVPTITLSRTRLRRAKPTEDKETKKTSLKNGSTDYDSKTISSLDRPLITSNGIDTVVHIKLNKLKLNDHNANNESSTPTTQDEKNDTVATMATNHLNSVETPEDNDASNKLISCRFINSRLTNQFNNHITYH